MSEEVSINVVGGLVHFAFMLGYWFLLSSPIWLIVWLVIDQVKQRRGQRIRSRLLR